MAARQKSVIVITTLVKSRKGSLKKKEAGEKGERKGEGAVEVTAGVGGKCRKGSAKKKADEEKGEIKSKVYDKVMIDGVGDKSKKVSSKKKAAGEKRERKGEGVVELTAVVGGK